MGYTGSISYSPKPVNNTWLISSFQHLINLREATITQSLTHDRYLTVRQRNKDQP